MVDVYVHDADIYCESCAEEYYTKEDGGQPRLYPDGGGEADCPQHCGSGPACREAITLSDGQKIGAFLENALTSDGVVYVVEACVEAILKRYNAEQLKAMVQQFAPDFKLPASCAMEVWFPHYKDEVEPEVKYELFELLTSHWTT